MQFETQRIFHIYNRGNNAQTIFFNRENYLYFLNKIRKYMMPYGNLLAWCLMPNHFHIMLEVLRTRQGFTRISTRQGFTSSEALTKLSRGETLTSPTTNSRSLNDPIGIMLRSYTRGINKEHNRTGAIFQQKTKAKCLNDPQFSPAYFNTAFGMVGNVEIEGTDYVSVCYNYIHLNPVYHKFVSYPSDWEFSSYLDIYMETEMGIL